ncbi:MAG: hypothetical protein ACREA2_07355 [Blastocatellia bacterium]
MAETRTQQRRNHICCVRLSVLKNMTENHQRRNFIRRSVAAAISFCAGCAHKKDGSLLSIKDADSIRTLAEQSPQSGGIEVIKLETGREFRFKGLAIDLKTEKAYLGSWDKKEIVVVSLKEKTHSTIKTGYSGKLNGMGTYLKRDKLYAVMNEVNDSPNARPVSVLLVIALTNHHILRSYEAVGVNGRHHFNHVVVDDNGIAYVSDTLKSAIYTVNTNNPADNLKQLVERKDLSRVHGIDLSADGSRLFSTSYDGGIRFFDLKTKGFSPFKDLATADNDGLKYYEGCLYGVGNNALRKYTLNKAEDGIIRTEVLLSDHEFFNDPRCLHIEAGYLYCLANIEFEPVEFRRSGKTTRKTPLSDSYLIKLKLDENVRRKIERNA